MFLGNTITLMANRKAVAGRAGGVRSLVLNPNFD
jgi:hypothetical protein